MRAMIEKANVVRTGPDKFGRHAVVESQVVINGYRINSTVYMINRFHGSPRFQRHLGGWKAFKLMDISINNSTISLSKIKRKYIHSVYDILENWANGQVIF